MAESNEITTGDVVCLKSDKEYTGYQKFTVGSQHSGSEYYVYWYADGQIKSTVISKHALHKLE